MLDAAAAWQAIARHLDPLPSESTPRAEALGRVLAAEVAATVDMPPADVSAMDGYAVAGDPSPGEVLPVVGVAAAGHLLSQRLEPGQAAKIMTGAVVPPGANRVVQVEWTDGGDEQVRLDQVTPPGAHIRRAGEVVATGDRLFAQGTVLTPGALSMLASHGHAEVPTHRPPRVRILATGDEVVPPEDEPAPGQLRDSNSSFLLAAGRSLGLDFEPLGIAPDDPDSIAELIRRGLEAEVLLLCGGVSMGDYDYVEAVLDDLGCDTLFDKVAIQPGKPLVVARQPSTGRWVFGLPGNPASVMVTFWLFVRPALRRMMGLDDGYWHGGLDAELASPLPGAKGRDRFLPTAISIRDGALLAHPAPPVGSHDVASYSVGSALVRVPAHSPPRTAGERCQVLPLADWRIAGHARPDGA